MLEENSELVNKIPEAFAHPILAQVTKLYLQKGEENNQIMRAAITELSGASENTPSTVLPASSENPAYEEESSLDKTAFLKEHLHGKVLDIGAGGIFELEEIVPDNMATYVDSHPFPGQVQADAPHLPFDTASFDSIYSRNCMALDPAEIVPEALRVLKPDGTMVMAISVGTLENAKQGLLSSLTVLQKNGINFDAQCKLTLNTTALKHKALGIKSTQPEILLTVKRTPQSAT